MTWWWWPFKTKREDAVRVDREFRDSLSQALRQQEHLQDATEKLKTDRHQRIEVTKQDADSMRLIVPTPTLPGIKKKP